MSSQTRAWKLTYQNSAKRDGNHGGGGSGQRRSVQSGSGQATRASSSMAMAASNWRHRAVRQVVSMGTPPGTAPGSGPGAPSSVLDDSPLSARRTLAGHALSPGFD